MSFRIYKWFTFKLNRSSILNHMNNIFKISQLLSTNNPVLINKIHSGDKLRIYNLFVYKIINGVL